MSINSTSRAQQPFPPVDASTAFVVQLRGKSANIRDVRAPLPPLPDDVDALVTLVARGSVPSTAIAGVLRGLADLIERQTRDIERTPWGSA